VTKRKPPPPTAVEQAETRRRQQALHRLHADWTARWAASTPVPSRPGSEDVGFHHLDMGASPEAEAEFQAAAAALYPLPPDAVGSA